MPVPHPTGGNPGEEEKDKVKIISLYTWPVTWSKLKCHEIFLILLEFANNLTVVNLSFFKSGVN